METRYFRIAPETPAAVSWLDALDRIRLTSVETETRDDPEFGVRAGDMVGVLAIPHPTAAAMDRAVLEYADVMMADAGRLRELVGGKIVLVGDFRRGGDRHPATGGIEIPGSLVHAAALDILRKRLTIREPQGGRMAALITVAALIGVIAMTLAGTSAMRRVIMLGGGALAVIVCCVAAYYAAGVLCNPLVPVAALLVAGGLAVLVPTEAHTRI